MSPDWHLSRACIDSLTPDYWVEDDLAGHGKHVCLRHCPVAEQCNNEQLKKPEPGVYGGLLWVQTFNRGARGPVHPAHHQPKELWCYTCQVSSATTARTANMTAARAARGATVYIGASDAA